MSQMRRYILRGYEGDMLDSLRRERIICLLGLPGVGKSTTARYLGIKLKHPVVCLGSEYKKIEFRDENGDERVIRVLPLFNALKEERGAEELLAHALVKVVNGSFFEVPEKLKSCFNRLKSKIKEAIERGEEIHKIDVTLKLAGKEIKELAERLGELVGINPHEVARHIVEFIKEHGHELKYASTSILDIFGYIVGISAGISILKGIKKLIERKPKLKGDVVFLLDDIADLDVCRIGNFIEWLIESGGKVIVVRRMDFESYMKMLEILSDESKSIDDLFENVIPKAVKRYVKWREQIFLIDSPRFDEFVEILKANGYEVKGEVSGLIYQASAGSISVAMMLLDAKVSFDELKEFMKAHRYFPMEEILKEKNVEKRREMILSNKNVLLDGIYSIYTKLKKENACFLVLFVQDVAEEELEEFCKKAEMFRRKGCNCFPDLNDYEHIVEIKREKWIDGYRKVYTLREEWKKFRIFLEGLIKFHKEGEEVLREIIFIRKTMLEVMTEELRMNRGGHTGRMVLYSLEHCEFLKDIIDLENVKNLEWLSKVMALWCASAISGFKIIGELYAILTLKLVERGMEKGISTVEYAKFLSKLAHWMVAGVRFGVEGIKSLVKKLKGDDIVEALKLEALSEIASVMVYEDGKREFEEILKRVDKLEGDLKNYVELWVRIHLADFYQSKNKLEESRENLRKALNLVKELKDKLEKGEVDDNLKKYADAILISLNESFKDIEGNVYYYYARILLDLDELDEALEYFENARKIYEELNGSREILVCEGWIRRIIALKNDEYEFDELMRKADEWIIKIDTFTYSAITSEYIISRAVKGSFDEDVRKRLKLKHLIPFFKRITLPMLSLFGIMPIDTKLLEEFEVEEAYPRVKDYLVKALGSLLKDEECKRIIDAIMDYEYIELKRGKNLNETYFLKLVKDIIILIPPVSSMQAFARILRLYMEGKIEEAVEIAENVAKKCSKLPSRRLFRELAEALRDEISGKPNAKDKVRKAFLKLFYFHI